MVRTNETYDDGLSTGNRPVLGTHSRSLRIREEREGYGILSYGGRGEDLDRRTGRIDGEEEQGRGGGGGGGGGGGEVRGMIKAPSVYEYPILVLYPHWHLRSSARQADEIDFKSRHSLPFSSFWMTARISFPTELALDPFKSFDQNINLLITRNYTALCEFGAARAGEAHLLVRDWHSSPSIKSISSTLMDYWERENAESSSVAKFDGRCRDGSCERRSFCVDGECAGDKTRKKR